MIWMLWSEEVLTDFERQSRRVTGGRVVCSGCLAHFCPLLVVDSEGV